MPNMSLKKNEMPSQEPNVRNKNFKEVALGYTPEQAIDEAKRCLNCKNRPCVSGCPVNIMIPDFIAKMGPIRSLPRAAPCPPSAAGSAPRRASARSCACGA